MRLSERVYPAKRSVLSVKTREKGMRKSVLICMLGLVVGVALALVSVIYQDCISYRCADARCVGVGGTGVPPSCTPSLLLYVGIAIIAISLISLIWQLKKTKK